MPTTAQVTAASTTLTTIARAQVLSLIRGSSRYREQVGLYPSLADKVDAATTVQIQQMNAALTLIDAIGDGTVALTGGEDAVDYDQVRDREQLVSYMIDTLYEAPAVRSGVAVSSMNPIRTNVWCSTCGCNRWRCPCP
jgi:hypothetical protein